MINKYLVLGVIISFVISCVTVSEVSVENNSLVPSPPPVQEKTVKISPALKAYRSSFLSVSTSHLKALKPGFDFKIQLRSCFNTGACNGRRHIPL